MNANPHNCHARIASDAKVHPTFSMRALPPLDMRRGSTKAVDAALEASRAYTMDCQEAGARVNEEVGRQLRMANRVDVDDDDGGGGGPWRWRAGTAGSSWIAGASDGAGPAASKGALERLKDLPDERRDIRGRRPGQAFEEAREKGETPFRDQPELEGPEG